MPYRTELIDAVKRLVIAEAALEQAKAEHEAASKALDLVAVGLGQRGRARASAPAPAPETKAPKKRSRAPRDQESGPPISTQVLSLMSANKGKEYTTPSLVRALKTEKVGAVQQTLSYYARRGRLARPRDGVYVMPRETSSAGQNGSRQD